MFLVEWLLHLPIYWCFPPEAAGLDVFVTHVPPAAAGGGFSPRVRFTAVMFEATCVALYTSTFRGVPFLDLKDG